MQYSYSAQWDKDSSGNILSTMAIVAALASGKDIRKQETLADLPFEGWTGIHPLSKERWGWVSDQEEVCEKLKMWKNKKNFLFKIPSSCDILDENFYMENGFFNNVKYKTSFLIK